MAKWLLITLLVLFIIVILVVIVSSIAHVQFEKSTNNKVKHLFTGMEKKINEILRKEELENLPQPVQKWLENANVIGKEKIFTVRLKQKGKMRIKEDGPWMNAQAVQYFRTDEPGFV